MTKPLMVIAAGGTGGHMFPAQALATEMLRRGWRVTLASDDRGLRYADGFPSDVERREVRAASPLRGGIFAKLLSPFKILFGIIETICWFLREKPACVVGFGGYPSMPAMSAAYVLRLPRIIHEQNGVLGRVNRLFAARVAALACGVYPVSNAPKSAKQVFVGNPVRDQVLALSNAPMPDDDAFNLLVFGGSQGASVFSRLLPDAIKLLPEGLRTKLKITQQVRAGEIDSVKSLYSDICVMSAELAPFFNDMPDRIKAAHLVVSRSGASSVAELGVIGRPSILVPYPNAMDDHQTANAQVLANAGAAILAQEKTLSAAVMAGYIQEILESSTKRDDMANAAIEQGRPQAAIELADLAEGLSKK